MSEERQQAWKTAHAWLDGRMNLLVEMVPGDPDCDACVLARQYLHALDKIAQLTEITRQYAPHQLNAVQMHLSDRWPGAIQ